MSGHHNSVGKCIYCGAKDVPLTREHIVPFAFNGDMVLHDASCRPCARLTGRIEQYVARNMFGAFRTAKNLQSRRPKERPSFYPVDVTHGAGTFRVDVPVAEYPLSIGIPVLPPARYLRGLSDANDIECQWWIWHQPEKLFALAAQTGQPEVTISVGECSPSKWSQLLAKVAHASAVQEFGVDGFEPLAVDLALGHTQSINYLVGCPAVGALPPEETSLHNLTFWTHNRSGLIVADLRLFASIGAPRYHVVVGLKKERERSGKSVSLPD